MPRQKRYESWGRYPKPGPTEVVPITDQLPSVSSMLPFGLGRSYGDTCLNDNGSLLDAATLSSLDFNEETGVIRCGSGVVLADVLQEVVPTGWMLPVTPGTKYVTVGGAIAHDVHGKNHEHAGTFGCHVKQFELLRSSGERLICSLQANEELFRSTIAGMGLTGLITWAEFELKRIIGPYLQVERFPFETVDEFVELSSKSFDDYEYTVAWFDCSPQRGKFGRGIFTRANHSDSRASYKEKQSLVGYIPGGSLGLNDWTATVMNKLYYQFFKHASRSAVVDFDSFFYPLDAIENWNRYYGSEGIIQYQCVIPFESLASFEEMFERLSRSGMLAYLGVLKTFGSIKSPGMMSFPRPGVTLALDFPNRGARLLRLLDELDEVTVNAGGAVYPAKDARMSAEHFQRYYPQWREFARYVDSAFSSNFWRRVTAV